MLYANDIDTIIQRHLPGAPRLSDNCPDIFCLSDMMNDQDFILSGRRRMLDGALIRAYHRLFQKRDTGLSIKVSRQDNAFIPIALMYDHALLDRILPDPHPTRDWNQNGSFAQLHWMLRSLGFRRVIWIDLERNNVMGASLNELVQMESGRMLISKIRETLHNPPSVHSVQAMFNMAGVIAGACRDTANKRDSLEVFHTAIEGCFSTDYLFDWVRQAERCIPWNLVIDDDGLHNAISLASAAPSSKDSCVGVPQRNRARKRI